MADENIVQLPTLLERLADRLHAYEARDATNRVDWIEIQEGICLTFAEAREKFTGNIEFGQWYDGNGFGLNHQTRAAAIAMGEQPEALRKCLEATQRRSLEQIYKNEFERFTDVRKTTSRHTQPKLDLNNPSPEFERCKDAYDEIKAAGEMPTVEKVAERAGTSGTPARIAVAYKRGEEAPRPLMPNEMSANMAKRFAATVRKARAEIREELKVEVYRELDSYLQRIKERSDRADRILASHRGVMSKDVFRKIKACLHPDHNTFAHAAEALQSFSELEDVLVKPDLPPRPEGIPPLPSTVAELLRRKEEVAAARRAKRAQPIH